MSKKSNVKVLNKPQPPMMQMDEDGITPEFVSNMMGGMMQHASDSSRSEQATALKLTELALKYTKNPTTDTVFELFSRSADEVEELYGSPIVDSLL